MCDGEYQQTENNDKKLETYPESVLNFAECIKTATENTSPKESDESRSSMETKNELNSRQGNDSEKSSVLGFRSSTSVGSSCSPVSYSHHSCGSLFVKCAEHGRWPLLQTFTNRESPLSQKTFTNRPYHPRNRNSDETDRRPKKNDSGEKNHVYQTVVRPYVSKQSQKTNLRTPDTSLPGILSRGNGRKSKNRVKFANSFSELKEEKVNKKEELVSRPSQQMIVRRHNSLPDRRILLNGKNLSELNKIFNKTTIRSNQNYHIPPCNEEKGKLELKNKMRKQRSKSVDKINISETNEMEAKGNFEKIAESSRVNDSCGTYCNRIVKNCAFPRSFSEEKKVNFEREHRLNKFKKECHNGAIASDDLKNEVACLRSAMSRLKTESTELEHEIDFLETEVLLLRRELKKKDQDNIKLQREIHKLKSVLQEASIFKHEGDLLSSLQDSYGMPGQIEQLVSNQNPNKKQGVSGESSDHGRNHDEIEIQRYEKDFRSKQLIKEAIMENNFLKNLDTSQVREIVESVYPKQFCKGDYVVREGEAGSHLYVSAEGELEVIKDHKVFGRMGPGKAFGELAILYNCRRTASIKVISDAKVWVLDRQVFQKIMMKTGLQRLQENLNFLRSVPLLQSLNTEVLAKIADVLEVAFYPSGEHIIRQGASGDTFFIISSGSVKVTQEKPGREKEEEIRILNKGDYFGEQALLKEDWRTANVIALSPGVECLTLDRESFIQLIGDLSELQEKEYDDQVRGFSRPSSCSSLCDKQEYDYIDLEDLEVISTLGVGGFGRVELVQYSKNRSMTFALKCLKKQHIVETKQQEHVYSERNIMLACNSPFICRLYRTFRDSKYVYMLQEALLGGEVWTILREKGCFDDYATKFVTGCVIEAFEYLHTRGIVYRDLKPENLLFDCMGYTKLVDFGFSKRIGFSSKTWTFCGTPEYLAPEIILNKGHDRAVDYWSLGVLMHELLTGIPPFTAPDPMRTYNIILKGIDMIDFPKHITKGAQSLIKRLCRDSPSERLGYQRGGIQDIKKHKWFQGFDWVGLKQRALVPPITPTVTNPTDTSNFDHYSKKTVDPQDEFSNWDAEF